MLVGLGAAYYKYQYPYGSSHCCDLRFVIALDSYAAAHGDKFPTGGATPEASLGLLYPRYIEAEDLCGKTLPSENTKRLLESGQALTPETCDWHYVEGLGRRDGDSHCHIAILWDKVGLGHNGDRLPYGGHSVVFIGGGTGVIREADWERFLAEQQKAVEVLRQGETPSPPWVPDYAR